MDDVHDDVMPRSARCGPNAAARVCWIYPPRVVNMPPMLLDEPTCCVVDDSSDWATLVVCPFATVSRGVKEPLAVPDPAIRSQEQISKRCGCISSIQARISRQSTVKESSEMLCAGTSG